MRHLKSLICIILVFVIMAPIGQASELWVTTPQLTTSDKLRELADRPRDELTDHSFVSLFDRQLGHPVSRTILDAILDLDLKARQASLQGKFSVSLKYYIELRSMLEQVPNVAGIHKIMLTTLIRLAELQGAMNKPSEPTWRLAHAWAPKARLTTDLFSPQTIAKFKSLKSSTKKITVEVKALPESFTFIDGQRIEGRSSILSVDLEPGFHQAANLSPGAFWEFQNFELTDGKKPVVLEFKPTSAVKGDCQNPQYVGSPLVKPAKLLASFNDGNCERIFNGKTWYTIQGNSMEVIPSTTLIQGLAPPVSRPWYTNLTKSPLFWAGVGTLVVGGIVLYRQSQEQQSVVVPSQTMK